MDLHWLLTVSTDNSDGGQNNLVMIAISLLTRLCSADYSVSSFLREKLRIQATLTDLLTSVPLTNHSKSAKILDLLRHVTFKIRLQRQEAFLQDLISRLFEHINGKDEKQKNISMSLAILASLCHASYSVTSFVLNLISPEERKALMVKNVDDPVIQVLLLRFNFSLTRANLSSQLQDNVGHYVSQMLDAVCHTYGEEDCLLLQIYCDFLKDLGKEPRHREDLQRSISLEFIQQVFLVLDYSEGCNRANELIFRFAREAVSFYAGDIHSLLDLIVRTISARLESNISSAKPASVPDCYEAIMLLEFMLRTVKMQIEEAPEEMSTSQTQNVKLLLEQIVPVLCDLFVKDPMDRNSASDIDAIDQLERTTRTYTAILVTMSTIGEKEDWVDVISKQVNIVQFLKFGESYS